MALASHPASFFSFKHFFFINYGRGPQKNIPRASLQYAALTHREGHQQITIYSSL